MAADLLNWISAASYVNRPEKFRFGTVGVPVPGVQVKLDPADGEILLAGRGIMRGYHNMAEATAEMLTGDGWLRTGGIGGGWWCSFERRCG